MMSGGVDSSVTALLLQRSGYSVTGFTMRIPNASGCDAKRSCCGLEAAYISAQLGIPHYFLEVGEEFTARVIEPFEAWYKSGRTPSPCIDCNTEIKFKYTADYLLDTLGFSYVATGHYARIIDGSALARAADLGKDQSYFLYGIPKKRLPQILFPLGGMVKSETRAAAAEAKLPVARKEESMELCFTGQGDYRQALETGEPGNILDESGHIVGRHTGLASYTVGQRKGLQVHSPEPLYVKRIDAAANTITVALKDSLYAHDVSATEANVLDAESLTPGKKLQGKIRSQGEPTPCTVTRNEDMSFAISFTEPVFAPTPGQRLVLYDGDKVVAGGVIDA